MDAVIFKVVGATEAAICFGGQFCKVFFEKEPFGGYTVTIPALPAFSCYGETLEEAHERLFETIGDALPD